MANESPPGAAKKPLHIFRVLKAPAQTLMLSTGGKLMLVGLLDELRQQENGGLVWPSQETLALRWGMSERSVRRHIHEVCERGYAKRQQRSGTSNIYALNLNQIEAVIEAGPNVRSLRLKRPNCPAEAAKLSGRVGHDGRNDRPELPAKSPKSTGRTQEEPISQLGASKPSTVGPSQEERNRDEIARVTSHAADAMRISPGKDPTERIGASNCARGFVTEFDDEQEQEQAREPAKPRAGQVVDWQTAREAAVSRAHGKHSPDNVVERLSLSGFIDGQYALAAADEVLGLSPEERAAMDAKYVGKGDYADGPFNLSDEERAAIGD